MDSPLFVNANFIEKYTVFDELIHEVEKAFGVNTTLVPARHHHDFPNPKRENSNTLLLMPACNPGADSGVKVVSVNPYNGEVGLPAVQGSYLYMDASNGQLKAILEAKSLTAKRTAATSALASKYLSREDADSLLMVGTGTLSVQLIKAHTTVRPIATVYVWGRNFEKAKQISEELKEEHYEVIPVKDIRDSIPKVAIISCATLSSTPLLFGVDLIEGQHVDLVGSYKPSMREADDGVIQKSTVFVDAFGPGLKESGDIAVPLRTGILDEEQIANDLFGLCFNKKFARTSENEITLFKSVGHALEDLTAAKYYYQKYLNEHL